ncbi:MAG: molybdopterin dinucleotide binding domain-containing protein, partial [Bacteroidota bacterium]
NGARERKFNTTSGKAHFTVLGIPEHKEEAGTYLMMTIRSHDQFNTTIYGLNDRYRGIHQGRRVILMNEVDMQERGFQAKTVVNLYSQYEGVQRAALTFQVVPYPIPTGNVATYFPEANPLVPIGLTARKSKTPVSKCVRITIEKA